MIFEKMVRIPRDRVGALVGRRGSTKSVVESKCGVTLEIDGATGEVLIRSCGDAADESVRPIKAVEVVTAIGRGFAPDAAMTLLKGETMLHVISLSEFAGKSRPSLERIKSRIIGERGRARRNMEQLSGTRISVYGKTVSIIGSGESLRLAVSAVRSISGGSMHGAVYGRLESANRRQKQERMMLWETDRHAD